MTVHRGEMVRGSVFLYKFRRKNYYFRNSFYVIHYLHIICDQNFRKINMRKTFFKNRGRTGLVSSTPFCVSEKTNMHQHGTKHEDEWCTFAFSLFLGEG